MKPRIAPHAQRWIVWALAFVSLALLLAACERPASEPVSSFTPATGGATSTAPTTAATVPAAATRLPTTRPLGTAAATSAPTRAATSAASVVTPTRLPTATPLPPTSTPVPPTATPTRVIVGPTMTVKVYVIALGDAGKAGPKIGCDDSVVGIDRIVPQSSGLLTAAEKELVSIKDRTIGESGLYNALWQSNLAVDSVILAGTKVTVRLTGTTKLGGVCDIPRVIAQVKYTAMQNPAVKDVSTLLNGVPIEQALSLK